MQLYEQRSTIPVHTFNMCNEVYQSKKTYTQGNTDNKYVSVRLDLQLPNAK